MECVKDYSQFIMQECLNGDTTYLENALKAKFGITISSFNLDTVTIDVFMRYGNKDTYYYKSFKFKRDNDLMKQLDIINHFYYEKIDQNSFNKLKTQVSDFYINYDAFQIYLKEQNKIRFLFRLIGDSISKKYGENSNRMVKPSEIEFYISYKEMEELVKELIKLKAVRNYTSTGASRNGYGSRNGISIGDNYGLTGYGWELYLKDKQFRNLKNNKYLNI